MAAPIPQNNTAPVHNITSPKLDAIFAVQLPDPVKFVDTIVEEAIRLLASDILLEPSEGKIHVRIRIDGVLYPLGEVNINMLNQISARVKVLSNLDPTDKRKIQEGQFLYEIDGKSVNLRVEIAQTTNGEMVVIRIHERKTIVMDLSELGFNQQVFETYNKMIKGNGGLVIACGPTGSGKTTTLYSTITKLTGEQKNIMTIEDPVEFELDGVNQMQVSENTGFTFAEGIKTTLRLSPDIVLVGEIRDAETAGIAIESGLTGLLVLSTIHAQDSVSTLFRLLDLKIEPYLLNAALTGVIAQRLVRRVCNSCKAPYQPNQDELNLFTNHMGRAPKNLMIGKGCENCNGTGFRGRMGLYEILHMSPKLRDIVRTNPNEDELRQDLKKAGFITLMQDGFIKAEAGMTTIDEVLRNSFSFV